MVFSHVPVRFGGEDPSLRCKKVYTFASLSIGLWEPSRHRCLSHIRYRVTFITFSESEYRLQVDGSWRQMPHDPWVRSTAYQSPSDRARKTRTAHFVPNLTPIKIFLMHSHQEPYQSLSLLSSEEMTMIFLAATLRFSLSCIILCTADTVDS